MSASARTIRAPGAPVDLGALADRMDAAAAALEARHERHLAEAARALRDARERGRYRGRQVGRTRPRAARMVGGRDAFRSGHGDPDAARNAVLYVRNVRDPERYRPHGARKTLADHREDYLDELRRADPAKLTDAEGAMLVDLDLAADCRIRAAADRRVAAVLATDPDDWTVDPLERELAEEQAGRASVAAAELLARLAGITGGGDAGAVSENPDEARRRRISEGTRRGLARARAAGRHPGRPRVMPDETLARLRALRAEGLSYRAIAERMNAEGIPGPHGGRWWDRTARLALQRYGE